MIINTVFNLVTYAFLLEHCVRLCIYSCHKIWTAFFFFLGGGGGQKNVPRKHQLVQSEQAKLFKPTYPANLIKDNFKMQTRDTGITVPISIGAKKRQITMQLVYLSVSVHGSHHCK